MGLERQAEIVISSDYSPFHGPRQIEEHFKFSNSTLGVNNLKYEIFAWRWVDPEGDRLHGRISGWMPASGETKLDMMRLWFIEMFLMPTDKMLKFAHEHNIKQVLVHTNEAIVWAKRLGNFSYNNIVWVEGGLTESIERIYETLNEVAIYGNPFNCGVVIDLGHLFYNEERSVKNYEILLAKALNELTRLRAKYPQYRISFHVPLNHNGYDRDAVVELDFSNDTLKELLKMADGPITIESQGSPKVWFDRNAMINNGKCLAEAYWRIRSCISK